MQRDACFAAILSIALSLPLAAEPAQTGGVCPDNAQAGGQRPVQAPATVIRKATRADAPLMEEASATPGDIAAGVGPSPHLGELRAIAVYEANGNKVGAAILAQRLRKFGVTREVIQRFVDSARLHDGLPGPRLAEPEAEPEFTGSTRPEANKAKPSARLEPETNAPSGSRILAGSTLPAAHP